MIGPGRGTKSPMSAEEWDAMRRDHDAGRLAWQAAERLRRHAADMARLSASADRAGDADLAAWAGRQARAAGDGVILSDRTVPHAPGILTPLIDACAGHFPIVPGDGGQGSGYLP